MTDSEGSRNDLDESKEIDEVMNMIEGKMSDGVSRLIVKFSAAQEPGTKTEWYHHGRCDVKSPWANGTIGNSGEIDRSNCG